MNTKNIIITTLLIGTLFLSVFPSVSSYAVIIPSKSPTVAEIVNLVNTYNLQHPNAQLILTGVGIAPESQVIKSTSSTTVVHDNNNNDDDDNDNSIMDNISHNFENAHAGSGHTHSHNHDDDNNDDHMGDLGGFGGKHHIFPSHGHVSGGSSSSSSHSDGGSDSSDGGSDDNSNSNDGSSKGSE